MNELEQLKSGRAGVALERGTGLNSDRKLLRSARAGSRDAVEELVDRHWDRTHRIAFGILGDTHLAEDVTQEALMSILASLGRFDMQRAFEPWLHKIVTNRALDCARARERREQTPQLVQPAAYEQTPDSSLREALMALPMDQRTVVVLRHVAGYGTNEISRMLGVRRGTVGSRLRRGLDSLRNELEER